MDELKVLLSDTIAELERVGAVDEALGEWRQARGIPGLSVVGWRPKARLVPVGRAWRLGVVLLDGDGNIFATGEVTRAVEPQVAVTNRSAEAERKRELRRAAARGKFAEGESINLDWRRLDGIEPPLSLSPSGEVLVRLGSGRDIPLVTYLADRVALFSLD